MRLPRHWKLSSGDIHIGMVERAGRRRLPRRLRWRHAAWHHGIRGTHR